MASSFCTFAAFSVILMACSGADFDVAPVTDAATGADSANLVADSASSTDTGVQGNSDAVSTQPADAAPPVDCKGPALACTPSSNYFSHHDLAPGTALPVNVNLENKHYVSFLTSHRGRIEKIGLRLRRNDLGTGIEGTFTVAAFFLPCPDTWIPIGKHVKQAAEVGGDTTFYFNPDTTGGLVPFLPTAEKGARIAFVIETNSTRYTWSMMSAAVPSPNPLGHTWGVKTGTSAWKPSPSQIAATMSYIRSCTD